MKSTPPTEITKTATTNKTASLPTHTMKKNSKSDNPLVASTMNNSTPTVYDPQISHQPTTRQDQESVCLSSLSGTLSSEREEGIPSLNPSKSFLSSGSISLCLTKRHRRVNGRREYRSFLLDSSMPDFDLRMVLREAYKAQMGHYAGEGDPNSPPVLISLD